MSSIAIDREHGVAPCLLTCPICLEKSSIALPGMKIRKIAAELKSTPEKVMREGWLDHNPCNKCQGYMEMGIVLIGVDPEKTEDMKNPYRTGRMSVISEGFVRRVFSPEIVEDICSQRVCFVPNEVFEQLGIPETQEEVDALNATLPEKEEADDS
jgi:hypothetical protein